MTTTTINGYDWLEIDYHIYGGDPHTGYAPEVELREIRISGTPVDYIDLSDDLKNKIDKELESVYKEPYLDYKSKSSQIASRPI